MKKKVLSLALGILLSCTACGAEDVGTVSEALREAHPGGPVMDAPVVKEVEETAKEALKKTMSEKEEEETTMSDKHYDMPDMNNVDNTESFNVAVSILDDVSKPNENSVVSPLSLECAMAMVAEGADTTTKELMTKYLGTEDYSAISNYIKHEYMSSDTNSTLNIADSIWLNDKFDIKQSYVDGVKEKFNSDTYDFDASNPNESADSINSWVADKTENLITKLISPSQIGENTGLITLNAVYFKDKWNPNIQWEDTNEVGFTDSEGYSHDDCMITANLDTCYETDDYIAFGAYYDSGLEFIGVLPKKEGEFKVSDLDLGNIYNNRSYDYSEVVAYMPEFKYETPMYSFADSFIKCGYQNFFNLNEADFSKIADSSSWYKPFISDIIQKCTMDVNKEGTEASAATAVMMELGAAINPDEPILQPVEIKLNRPFAYMIVEPTTGKVVFVGKVVTLN